MRRTICLLGFIRRISAARLAGLVTLFDGNATPIVINHVEFLPCRILFVHYTNLLSMREFGPAKEKEETWPSQPVAPAFRYETQ